MKKLLTILISFILIACSSFDNKTNDDIEQNTLLTQQDTFSLNELWAMPDYVDSILINKSISKYRMQWPTWFAILIDIEKDTLKTYGSILDIKMPFDSGSDTLCIFPRTVTGEWLLTFNQKTRQLELKNTNSNREKNDPKVYIFKKRPDLRHLLDTLDNRHMTRTSFTNLFNVKLFSGTYQTIWPKNQKGKTITFNPEGTVNFAHFDTYKVRVYFGTSHPHKNKDVITFEKDNGETTDRKQYHWQFKGDTLIMTEFVRETTIWEGKKYKTDHFVLGDKQTKMIKIK